MTIKLHSDNDKTGRPPSVDGSIEPGSLDEKVVSVHPSGLAWCVRYEGSETLLFYCRRDAEEAARRLADRLRSHGFATWLEIYDRNHARTSRVRYERSIAQN